jgi:hypothetical protein
MERQLQENESNTNHKISPSHSKLSWGRCETVLVMPSRLHLLLVGAAIMLMCSCATAPTRPASEKKASEPGREEGYHLPENHWAKPFLNLVPRSISL